ncbi:hypothetical protein [Chthonobacter rhizosphaerae]|uniref:hypothetical protein n=1 Tax=Chthonobacter rhizosphaerae TaxID=2735553 RepID=UPI001FE6181B|nr:hypothetical protein [Chthonobacter rhizosphaerae]
MTKPRPLTLLGRLRAVVDVLDGARSSAAAINSGRRPSRQALRKLGIDEDAFDGIRIF